MGRLGTAVVIFCFAPAGKLRDRMLAGTIRRFKERRGSTAADREKEGRVLVRSPPSLLRPGPFSGRRKADTSRPSARSRVGHMTSTASLAGHRYETPRVRLLASEGGNEPALDPAVERSGEREPPPSLLINASRPRVSRPPPEGCGLPLHRRHATSAAATATAAAPALQQKRRTRSAPSTPRV